MLGRTEPARRANRRVALGGELCGEPGERATEHMSWIDHHHSLRRYTSNVARGGTQYRVQSLQNLWFMSAVTQTGVGLADRIVDGLSRLGLRCGGANAKFGVRGEVVAQRLTSAVDAAAHGAQLHPEGGADLLVGQAFDIT